MQYPWLSQHQQNQAQGIQGLRTFRPKSVPYDNM